MYSENDYRYYLAHGKWEWPNGKNSPAYNHDYYQKHKEKWKGYADSAKKKLGIDQAKKVAEEEERLRKWKNSYGVTKDLADYAQETGDRLAKEYEETGDHGAYEASRFAYRSAGDWKGDLYQQYDKYGFESRSNPSNARLSQQANYVNMLKNQYAKTPLGKIDNATKPGRVKVKKAVTTFTNYVDRFVDDLTKR